MAEILTVVESADGAVKKVTLELLALAGKLGEPAAVWLGPGYSDAAGAVLAEHGAAKIYVADNADLVDYVVAPKAEALAQIMQTASPAAVLIASSAEGKEIAARLAVKTDSGVITDAVDVAADLTATQSVFGGSTIVQSKVTTGTPIITVRVNSIAPEVAPAAGTRVDVAVDVSSRSKDRQGHRSHRRSQGWTSRTRRGCHRGLRWPRGERG